jgi:hypothetical protein
MYVRLALAERMYGVDPALIPELHAHYNSLLTDGPIRCKGF